MRIGLFFTSLFLMVASAGAAQDSFVVDSLTKLLATKSGGERYIPLYELAFEYVDTDNEKALAIIEEAARGALSSRDSLWIVKSMRVKGQVLSRLGRLPESIAVCQAAIPIVHRNGFMEEEAYILNSLATSYSFLGKDDTALEFFLRTLEIAQDCQDSFLIAQSLNNIGVFYYRLGGLENALDYLLSALRISRSINNVSVFQLNNIAMCYANLKQFDKAHSFVVESKRVCGDDCDENNLMIIRFTEAIILLNDKEEAKAASELLNCYVSAKREKAVRMQLEVIDVLAELYIKESRFTQAQTLLNEAEKLINSGYLFSREIMAIYSRYLQLHRLTGNIRLIAHYSDRYIMLKDSIERDVLTVSLMRTEAEFRERQNLARIAAQDEVILLKERIIKRQKLLNFLIGVSGVMLLAFILVLFRNYYQKRMLNRILLDKVKERTCQLEINRRDLLNIVNEKDLQIRRLSNIAMQIVQTARGLCYTGSREIPDQKARLYLRRILHTLDRLSAIRKFLDK